MQITSAHFSRNCFDKANPSHSLPPVISTLFIDGEGKGVKNLTYDDIFLAWISESGFDEYSWLILRSFVVKPWCWRNDSKNSLLKFIRLNVIHL
jgi:hypothetical protein